MTRGLIVDCFAGGGGASTGIEMALGRSPDIAINHDPVALAIHRANHPATEHLIQNVWQVDPGEIVRRGPVDLLWASPDCKHFSKAKGGKPVARNIRDLAWTVPLWAQRARPQLILLENVEEFRDWGPLITVEDGRLMPCPVRKGLTFRRWVRVLQRLGYRVGYEELRACDYGAPTIRKRLFLVARCDGAPIVFPEPTHARGGAGGLAPWRAAAECIDWSVPCPSIFARARPLADATLRRIARGVMRYVVEAAEPFIVPITHAGDDRVHPSSEPLRTVTTAHRGEMAIVVPTLVQAGYGERQGQAPRALDIGAPFGTIVAGGGRHALVAAFLAQHNGGMVGHGARAPLSTIMQCGAQQQLVAAHLVTLRNNCIGGGAGDPAATITTGGHHALVAAFLAKYYGTATGQAVTDPLHAATARARFGLVAVTIAGQPYAIIDIGMRMLTPRELFRAQGFPDGYLIDPDLDGRPITKTAQIAACGNSVCPPIAAALVRANYAPAAADSEAA